MSLTTDDVREFVASDPDDDETVPPGEARAAVAVDPEVASVEAVRDVREQFGGCVETNLVRTATADPATEAK